MYPSLDIIFCVQIVELTKSWAGKWDEDLQRAVEVRYQDICVCVLCHGSVCVCVCLGEKLGLAQ